MAKKGEFYVVARENQPSGHGCTWARDARDLAEAKRIKDSVEKSGGYPKGSTARIVRR